MGGRLSKGGTLRVIHFVEYDNRERPIFSTYYMTPKEALQEIINSPKNDGIWYKFTEDETLRTYFRVTALRILNGTAKNETMKKFFEKFGYEFETVVTKKI